VHIHYINTAVISPKVLLPSISPPGPIQGAMVGSSLMIQCIVNTVSEVESSSVMISWMRPGGDTITSNDRVTIDPITTDGNTYTSVINFTYLMEGDEGTYICNVTSLSGVSRSDSVEIETLTSNNFTHLATQTCTCRCIQHAFVQTVILLDVIDLFFSTHSHCECHCSFPTNSGSVTGTGL